MKRLRGSLVATLVMCASMAIAGMKPQRAMEQDSMKMLAETDVAKLRFLEGRWSGKAPDGSVFYEEYDFPSSTTLRSRRYPDAGFVTSTDGSTVALKDGKLIATWGDFTWQATSVENGGVTFSPVNAPSSFSWRRVDPDTVEVMQHWKDDTGAARHHALTLTRVH